MQTGICQHHDRVQRRNAHSGRSAREGPATRREAPSQTVPSPATPRRPRLSTNLNLPHPHQPLPGRWSRDHRAKVADTRDPTSVSWGSPSSSLWGVSCSGLSVPTSSAETILSLGTGRGPRNHFPYQD